MYGGNGILDHCNEFNVSDETVIIGRVGAYCGSVYFEKRKIWVSDNALYLKPIGENDTKFFYYLLKDQNLNQYAGGSSHPLLTQGRLNDLEFQIPPLPTQKAIAEILSSLDDKIELNNQINQNLEALAQALFKQWFVDFEFPNENGEPYKSSGGEMTDSELGEIPKGWDLTRFQEHVQSSRGLSYKGSGLTDSSNGLPLINLNSVYEGGGFKHEGLKFYSGEFKDRHKIQPWDLAVTNTEQGHKYLLIGFPAFIPKSIGNQAIFSHHIYRVTAKESSFLTNQFLYYLIKFPQVREQIIGACNGTTVNMLKIDGLETPRFVCPEQRIVGLFSSLVEGIWEKLELNHLENEKLKGLRDTLLPRLISGELEVNESLLKQTF